MPDKAFSDYFYGDEATQFTYFRIPCQLITHPRFKHLSTGSKLLYGMLLDRMSQPIKNEWYDDTGRVYIYYTLEKICNNLNCGRDKAMKLLAELDTGKGVNLIVRIKQGQGKPTRIYVKRFTPRELPPQRSKKPGPPTPPPEVDFADVQKSKKPTLIIPIAIIKKALTIDKGGITGAGDDENAAQRSGRVVGTRI